MNSTMLTGALLAGALVAAAAPAAAQTQARGDDWQWRGALAAGKTLEVRGINGIIRAEAATDRQAFVTAEKHARHDDPADVRIEVVEHAGGVTICAVYPGSGNRCAPGGGRMNVRDNDVEVDFVVHVPAGVTFEGHNVNGGVEAVGLSGRTSLNTVNGGITLDTQSGEAEAETVNGSIHATIRGTTGTGALRFETVNGGITVALPQGIGAAFDAETVNGGITSDFPITLSGRIDPRHMRGQLGQGGRELRLETVNGSIRLRSLP